MSAELHTRRKFLLNSTRLLVTVTSLAALSCACDPESSKKRQQLAHLQIENGNIILDLDKNEYRQLGTVGNGIKLRMGGETKPLIVTRLSATEVAAFSSQCTHAGSEVYLPENGRIVCGSGHGAVFDLRGNVVSGPATSSLERYEASLADKQRKISIRYFS